MRANWRHGLKCCPQGQLITSWAFRNKSIYIKELLTIITMHISANCSWNCSIPWIICCYFVDFAGTGMPVTIFFWFRYVIPGVVPEISGRGIVGLAIWPAALPVRLYGASKWVICIFSTITSVEIHGAFCGHLWNEYSLSRSEMFEWSIEWLTSKNGQFTGQTSVKSNLSSPSPNHN